MTSDAGPDTSRTQNFRRKVASAAQSELNVQKNRVAARAGDIAQAVRQTASQLREPNPAMADYVERAADRLDEWVTSLRDRDAEEILEDVRGFLRHRPALVIGGGFALGLLAARFVKSSGGHGGGDAWRYDYTSEGPLT